MNVLSLFDGMSCGHLALDRAGVPVTTYYASEVDKHAIAVTTNNYPHTVQLGDVTKWREWALPRIDILIGGSPCQGFSYAGKQLAFEDPRSKLFFEFVECLKFHKPRFFLLENVRMKKEHLQVISDLLGVTPICINSSLVSAQNRVRYYWTNIPGVTTPEDRGIRLQDVVETAVDKKYFLAGAHKQWLLKNRDFQLRKKYSAIDPGKAITLVARQYASWAGNFISAGADHALRKLTPVECERLQTVPDNYTAAASDAQRYKMLGNGWTVEVIAHIFKNISNKNGQFVHSVIPYATSTKEKPMATSQEVVNIIKETKELLASRMEHAKMLRETLRTVRAHARTVTSGDGAAYRREVSEALAEIKTDVKALKDEIAAWDDIADALERDLIQSLSLTNEKHVAYTDLGTLSVVQRGYWQFGGDAEDPEAKAAGELQFLAFLEQEVRVNSLTLADAMNLRQNRFAATNLEETIALYEAQGLVVPGVKKVSKSTISFRKA